VLEHRWICARTQIINIDYNRDYGVWIFSFAKSAKEKIQTCYAILEVLFAQTLNREKIFVSKEILNRKVFSEKGIMGSFGLYRYLFIQFRRYCSYQKGIGRVTVYPAP